MIRTLLEQGVVVICAGGGGIPTTYTDAPAPAGRRLGGVEAVIDKDLASALLAIEIGDAGFGGLELAAQCCHPVPVRAGIVAAVGEFVPRGS